MPMISKFQKPKNLIPGPGAYEEQIKFPNEKLPVSSSMFKSDSVRDLAQIKRGPGPALYNPKNEQDKKIFNFNPSKMWIQ